MAKRPTSKTVAAVKRPDTSIIATTHDGRDLTKPFVRGLQQPRDPRLSMAVDWGVYDVILSDDQVFSTLQQRRGAVVSRNWDVLPGDESDPRSVAAAEALKDNLQRIGWDRVTDKMLYSRFYGYAVAEIVWETDSDSDVMWAMGIKVRHARRFRFDDQDQLRLITRGTPQGELLPDRKFWVVQSGASDDDEPYGRALAEWLYWPTLFKRNGLRFWNNFLDKFGEPTKVARYPRGTPQSEIDKVLAALQAIATDTGIALPEGFLLELLEAKRSGVADYKDLCRYMDGAISKVVLSQTMTTDDGASLSQAKVHSDVKMEVIKADADLLSDGFNAGPARWFTDYNFGPDVASPIVMRDVEEEIDTKHQAETDEVHARNGWVRTDESFQDTYGDGYERKAVEKPAVDPVAPAKPGTPANDDASVPDGGKNPKQQRISFAADDPRPLYVFRPLLNGEQLLAWARAQGFTSVVDAADLHVTVTYSKQPVNWFKMGQDWASGEPLRVRAGGPRLVDRLGDEGAVVLHFYDGYLEQRHKEMISAGASWDYPGYLAHVTFSYDASGVDLANVKPFTGELLFGPEIFEPIVDDWQARVRSLAEGGGDYAAPDAEGALIEQLVDTEAARVGKAMTGDLFALIAAARTPDDVQKLLEQMDQLGMDDAPLRDSLERAAFAMRLDQASTKPAPDDGNA